MHMTALTLASHNSCYITICHVDMVPYFILNVKTLLLKYIILVIKIKVKAPDVNGLQIGHVNPNV